MENKQKPKSAEEDGIDEKADEGSKWVKTDSEWADEGSKWVKTDSECKFGLVCIRIICTDMISTTNT